MLTSDCDLVSGSKSVGRLIPDLKRAFDRLYEPLAPHKLSERKKMIINQIAGSILTEDTNTVKHLIENLDENLKIAASEIYLDPSNFEIISEENALRDYFIGIAQKLHKEGNYEYLARLITLIRNIGEYESTLQSLGVEDPVNKMGELFSYFRENPNEFDYWEVSSIGSHETKAYSALGNFFKKFVSSR